MMASTVKNDIARSFILKGLVTNDGIQREISLGDPHLLSNCNQHDKMQLFANFKLKNSAKVVQSHLKFSKI